MSQHQIRVVEPETDVYAVEGAHAVTERLTPDWMAKRREAIRQRSSRQIRRWYLHFMGMQDMRKLLLHPRKRNPIFLRIPVHELRDCGIWEISDRLTGRYALQYTF